MDLKLCNKKQGKKRCRSWCKPEVAAYDNPKNATFQITDTKLYAPVVTLSSENDKRLLEQLRTGFKRIIKWNKNRSEMTNHIKNNNLNYLIDRTFTKVNRLFILSFENENNRTSFQNIMYQLFK